MRSEQRSRPISVLLRNPSILPTCKSHLVVLGTSVTSCETSRPIAEALKTELETFLSPYPGTGTIYPTIVPGLRRELLLPQCFALPPHLYLRYVVNSTILIANS